jgi:hypothetical protein
MKLSKGMQSVKNVHWKASKESHNTETAEQNFIMNVPGIQIVTNSVNFQAAVQIISVVPCRTAKSLQTLALISRQTKWAWTNSSAGRVGVLLQTYDHRMQQGMFTYVRCITYTFGNNLNQYELHPTNTALHLRKTNPSFEIKIEQSHLCCKDWLAPELLCDEDPILA